MSDKPIKLVLTDIDGTILPYGQKVISERMRAAMHACIDAGVHVGPASGRAITGVRPPFGGDDELCATALATNGMQIYVDGELVYEAHVPVDQLAEVVAFCDRHPETGLIVFDGPQVHIVRGTREGLAISFPSYATTADYTGELPDYPVVKANVFTPKDMDVTRELFEAIKREVPGLDFSLPMAGFLNMTPKGWNKGTAIDVMCEHMGIGLDEVCVFGDAGNDVEMLAHVENSAVVEAAAPEAVAAAKHVIGRVEDDAVADVLDRIAAGLPPFE